MQEDLLEIARLFLPKYLTPEQHAEMFTELSKFPHLDQFFLPPGRISESMLQGDGWQGFVYIDFDTCVGQPTTGLVLSNSCDIDPANKPPDLTNVLFSPLISVSRYEKMLRTAGSTDDQVANVLGNIRKQRVTDMFHLPSKPYGPEESIALLGHVHSHPLDRFLRTEKSLVFRLSQSAFWCLLIKLSIHFCRAQEGVARFA